MSGSFFQPRSCRKTKGAVPANSDRQCDSTMNPISHRKEDAASSCVCPPSCVVLASAQPPSGILWTHCATHGILLWSKDWSTLRQLDAAQRSVTGGAALVRLSFGIEQL